MKMNITAEDLLELSEWQRKSLRSRWIPRKYDLAVALVCMNVETDEMDKIEFVVGDILAREINRDRRSEVRNYPAIYDCYDVTFRSLRQLDEEMELAEGEEQTSEEDFEYGYIRQEDYFNLEYCLPLLNIGQMIKMLEDFGYKSTDYNIGYNLNKNKYIITRPDSEFLDGDYEAEELCDMLWSRVKSLLE